jgi:hypothetical protein
MEFLCEHCERAIGSQPFQITSEDADIILLNLIVCAPCAEQAVNLGLKVTQLNLSIARNKRRVSMPVEI